MAAAAVQLPSVRLFRRNTGAVKIHDRFVRFGLTGQADFYAICKGGRHVEIEVKNVRGKLSDAQERWRHWCESWSVPWITLHVRNGERPTDTVSRWISELRELLT